MKTLVRNFLTVMLLTCKLSLLMGQTVFPSYQTKDELKEDVATIIQDFDLFMKDRGITPPFVPGVQVETAPFLIKWDGPNQQVILPYWDELWDEQKKLFRAWQGDNAEEFFTSLFNWFFVPHELGHFIEASFNKNELTPYQSEIAANEFAIAFLSSLKENQKKMEYIRKNLEEVIKALPPIDFGDLSEEEYFNKNYQNLGSNPNVYGYYQFNFILNILENQDQIDLQKYTN